MNKLVLTLLLVMTSAAVAHAQKCDCSITPFKPDPPCWNQCTVRLIVGLDLTDLKIAFDIKEETALKIIQWNKQHRVKSLDDYRTANILDASEVEQIMKRANSFDKHQLEYLGRPRVEKNKFSLEDKKEIFAVVKRPGVVEP